jgi:hypothetical protein
VQLNQLKALRGVCCAVIEAVEECGHTGAPAGVLYSVLSSQGCNKSQFDGLMRGLCGAGYLRRDGMVYFATGKEIGAAPAPAAPRGWESVGGVA